MRTGWNPSPANRSLGPRSLWTSGRDRFKRIAVTGNIGDFGFGTLLVKTILFSIASRSTAARVPGSAHSGRTAGSTESRNHLSATKSYPGLRFGAIQTANQLGSGIVAAAGPGRPHRAGRWRRTRGLDSSFEIDPDLSGIGGPILHRGVVPLLTARSFCRVSKRVLEIRRIGRGFAEKRKYYAQSQTSSSLYSDPAHIVWIPTLYIRKN